MIAAEKVDLPLFAADFPALILLCPVLSTQAVVDKRLTELQQEIAQEVSARTRA